MKITLYLLFPALLLSSCYSMRKSRGGGQISTIPPRTINAADVALPPGYKIEAVASGLTFPSSATLDGSGNLCVITSGYSYGEVFELPKLMRVNKDGSTTTLTTGTKNGPWTCLIWWEGAFYVSEGGELEGGRILRISPDGKEITPLVSGLPSMGDHHTDCMVIKDGYLYFGQGTATNSGVVGEDNAMYGWLKRKPDFHDIPCKDITLAGVNYTSHNTLDSALPVVTGAYLPYGTPSTAGQVVKGRVPCSGAIMRIPLAGGAPEVVAWGLRNPYGLALAPTGKIYISENGYDDRGSRPVWGAGDILWELQTDAWYGFPDFSGGRPMLGKEEFKPPGKSSPEPVLKVLPGAVPHPIAVFGVHSSANAFDFSSNATFGHAGEAFVAEFGDMAPETGKVLNPVGFKIVRVNVGTGNIEDFAVNRSRKNGPASKDGGGGLERPLSIRFSPDGASMYVVDFGIIKMTERGPQPQLNTGVVWKITKQ